MADSKYPGELDTDSELPRVDDNISEIGGDAINGLRSAVFNIEETLGLNPQGTAADVATRLGQSLNPDGTIKASALSSVGLATLPITNNQVATNAGIEEIKLDLDYSTVSLRTLIAELDVFANSINTNLLNTISNFTQHIAHPGNFGRHQTRDIDGYAGKFASFNLQEIITDIDNRIVDHFDTSKIGAHLASNISVDDTTFNIITDNVQDALEQLDDAQTTVLRVHRDSAHSNSLFQAQDTFLDGYGRGPVRVALAAINAAPAGDSSIIYTSPPAALSEVIRGDRIDITFGSTTLKFFVNSVNAGTGQVNFFGKLPQSISSGSAIIYHKTEENFNPSALILAKRSSDTIQMVHPNAAFILSNGLDARRLSATVNNIKLRWFKNSFLDESPDLDLKTALDGISTSPSTWTAENVAFALNTLFQQHSPGVPADDFHFPLIAFAYKGEVGIALDEADEEGYIEIVAPSSQSAWGVLGFTTGTIKYALGPRRVLIDGYGYDKVHKKFDKEGEILGNGFDFSADPTVNLRASGVKAGDIARISGGSVSASRTTVSVNNVGTDSMTTPDHNNFDPDTVDVRVYGDTFDVVDTTPSDPTFYELFVDAYDADFVQLQGAPRAVSSQTPASTEDMRTSLDIVDVSRSFREASRRVYFDLSENTVALGQQGSGITLAADSYGPTVVLPSTSAGVGFRFKLFDDDRVNYIEFQVANTAYLSFLSDAALDIEISDRISEERYTQLGVVLFNTSEFRHLRDRRQFGSIGRFDVRDDFKRDYISYPASLLRSNGVIEGFSVAERSDDAIDAYGGIVFNNGSISVLETRDFAIPQDGSSSTYNLFVDRDNILKFLKNDQSLGSNGGIVSNPSLSEIMESEDKTIIAQVDVNASNVITEIRDYRRFVNNLDDKVDLVVEENSITHGGFASLNAAINWINAQDSLGLPTPRIIKIRGEVEASLTGGEIALPDGITIMGDVASRKSSSARPKITITGTGTALFDAASANGVAFKDLLFEQDGSADMTEALFSGSAMSNFYMENCYFKDLSGTGSSLSLINTTTIDNLYMRNCFVEFATTSVPNYAINTSTSMTDINILECSFTSANTSTFADMFRSTAFTNISVMNSVFTFASNTTNRIIVPIGGGTTLTNSRFINNNITSPTTSSGILFSIATATDVEISGNVCALSSSAQLIGFSGGARCKVNKNYVDVCSTGISIIGTEAIVSENIIEDFATTAILTSGNNAIIKDNIIKKSSNVAGPAIEFAPTGCIVSGNTIVCTATNSATDNAIEGSGGAGYRIIDNFISNAGTTGYLTGIYVSSGDNAVISGNVIDGFSLQSGNIGNGIYAVGPENTIVSNNVLTDMSAPIVSTSGLNVIYSNNYCETSTGREAFRLDGANGSIKVENNMFFSPATSNSDDLVTINNTGDNVKFSNNTFIHSHTSTSSHSLLDMTGGGSTYTFTNNEFKSLGVGGDYAVSPIVNDSIGDVIFAYNDLRDISYTGGSDIINLNGNGVDINNFGQGYTVSLPLSASDAESNSVGTGSAWIYVGHASNNHPPAIATASTALEEVSVEFGSEIVPAGATLTSVDITFSAENTMTTWTINITKWSSPSGSTITDVVATTNLTQTASLIIENVSISSEVVSASNRYAIVFSSNLSSSGLVNIYQIRVNYTL